MGKSAPSAPSPDVTAAAQSQMNRETAITNQQLNMIDQYNPYGSVTYAQTGNNFTPSSNGERYYYNPQTGEYQSAGKGGGFATEEYVEDGKLVSRTAPLSGSGLPGEGWQEVTGSLTPKYSQTTALSPEQQAIFNETQKTQQNLANLATQQSGALADHLGNKFSFNNDDAAQWAYDLASPRLLQQQQQSENQLRTTLANKGIREGSAVWDAEMSRMTNANTDQMNQLALTGRQQAYNEQFNNYTTPINTITALMSGSQVGNPAQSSPATPQTSVGGVDYAGLVNQNYKNQLGAYEAKLGGIGGLFGSVLGAAGKAGGFGALFSDERLKENIRRVGQTDAGLPIYVYNYIGDQTPHMGVMAQEALVSQPEAVHQHDSGYLMVNYGDVR